MTPRNICHRGFLTLMNICTSRATPVMNIANEMRMYTKSMLTPIRLAHWFCQSVLNGPLDTLPLSSGGRVLTAKTIQPTTADLCTLITPPRVAREFIIRAMRSPTSLHERRVYSPENF
jgi:hypothetical protein